MREETVRPRLVEDARLKALDKKAAARKRRHRTKRKIGEPSDGRHVVGLGPRLDGLVRLARVVQHYFSIGRSDKELILVVRVPGAAPKRRVAIVRRDGDVAVNVDQLGRLVQRHGEEKIVLLQMKGHVADGFAMKSDVADVPESTQSVDLFDSGPEKLRIGSSVGHDEECEVLVVRHDAALAVLAQLHRRIQNETTTQNARRLRAKQRAGPSKRKLCSLTTGGQTGTGQSRPTLLQFLLKTNNVLFFGV